MSYCFLSFFSFGYFQTNHFQMFAISVSSCTDGYPNTFTPTNYMTLTPTWPLPFTTWPLTLVFKITGVHIS